MNVVCAWCHPGKKCPPNTSHGVCEFHRFALEFEMMLIKWKPEPAIKTVQGLRLVEKGN